MATKSLHKNLALNRAATFNYFIEEEFETGIVLLGSEVKSLRAGKANISDAYAGAVGNEIFLLNAHIPEYDKANQFNHETRKPRKLLLHRKQIKKLIGKTKTKGYTLVPMSVYLNEKNRIKVKLALAKGKATYDKRATEKERDWQRDKARAMRGDD